MRMFLSMTCPVHCTVPGWTTRQIICIIMQAKFLLKEEKDLQSLQDWASFAHIILGLLAALAVVGINAWWKFDFWFCILVCFIPGLILTWLVQLACASVFGVAMVYSETTPQPFWKGPTGGVLLYLVVAIAGSCLLCPPSEDEDTN